MAENTAANHGEHFNESIVNEVILEDMKKNRIDHMKYLPGMETMEESDVMEKVITAMNAYDYDQYTEKDVRRALEHDNRTIEDFQALLSPAALPLLEEIAQAARVETRKHFGNSVYMFTPIYIANYCENYCIYCGFNCHNKIRRAHAGNAVGNCCEHTLCKNFVCRFCIDQDVKNRSYNYPADHVCDHVGNYKYYNFAFTELAVLNVEFLGK